MFSQNAGNAISETQILKISWGACPQTPLANSCLLYSAHTTAIAYYPGGKASRKWALWQICPTTEESLKNALPPEAHTIRFQSINTLYNMVQLIEEPARVARTSATIMDLILTNSSEKISHAGVIHVGISDRSLIYAVHIFKPLKRRPTIKKDRNFKHFSETEFISDLTNIPWQTNFHNKRSELELE
jgi:hypothetical protein